MSLEETPEVTDNRVNQFIDLLFPKVKPAVSVDKEEPLVPPLLQAAEKLLRTSSEQRLRMFGAIILHGPVTPAEIRELASSPKSTATAALAEWCVAGLVRCQVTTERKHLYSISGDIPHVLPVQHDDEVTLVDVALNTLNQLVERPTSGSS